MSNPQTHTNRHTLYDAIIIVDAEYPQLTSGRKTALMMTALERHRTGTSFARTLRSVRAEVGL